MASAKISEDGLKEVEERTEKRAKKMQKREKKSKERESDWDRRFQES